MISLEVLNKSLLEGKSKIAIVGLGYVGLPLAVAFSKKGFDVLAFDINPQKINRLKEGIDDTNEVALEDIQVLKNIKFSYEPQILKEASVLIVCVPTPINDFKQPDLSCLKDVSQIIGSQINSGSIIVFESTVYPGATEEICAPIIEKYSGLSFSKSEIFLGYSPERINPGDKTNSLEKIVKVVSAQSPDVCRVLSKIYATIIDAGIHEVSSIKVAEAAKVIENTQRDLNIALMNELSLIFDKMNINTEEVLKAAATKWNFISFYPGLVGGHCIGVDPYYLTSKAESLNYHPQVVLAGRRINDSMSFYVAQKTVEKMIYAGQKVCESKILILGATFKEDTPDFRNSKVFDIVNYLENMGSDVFIFDPYKNYYNKNNQYKFVDYDDINDIDVFLVTVPHKEVRHLKLNKLKKLSSEKKPVLIDLRWLYDAREAEEEGFLYWRL